MFDGHSDGGADNEIHLIDEEPQRSFIEEITSFVQEEGPLMPTTKKPGVKNQHGVGSTNKISIGSPSQPLLDHTISKNETIDGDDNYDLGKGKRRGPGSKYAQSFQYLISPKANQELRESQENYGHHKKIGSQVIKIVTT